MRRTSMVVRLASIAAVGLITMAAALVVQSLLSDDTGSRAQFQEVTSDAEWIQLIRDAKEQKETAGGVLPDLRVQPDVIVITDCAELPKDAIGTQMAVQTSPDGSRRRSIEYFLDQTSESRIALVLESDQDLTNCDDARKSTLLSDAQEGEVDRHICQEMERMARGVAKTDPTLREASPDVARAYLKTFCE